MNRRLILSLAIIILVFAAIGGATMAWFTAQSEPLENVFTAGTVDIEAEETVVAEGFSMDNWNPGDCAEKQFEITNIGTKRIALRGKIEVKWEQKVDGVWVSWVPDPVGNDPDYNWFGAAKFQLCDGSDPEFLFNPSDWDIVYNETDKAFYITYVGNGGEIPGLFGDPLPTEEERTVKFCLKVCLDGPLADNDYQGKKFTLTATFQAIQASHSDEWVWDNVDFETGLELTP